MNVGAAGPTPIYLAPQVINPLVASTQAIAMVVASRADLGAPATQQSAGEATVTVGGPEAPVSADGTVDVYA